MSDVAKTPREELECKKKYLYEHSMFWECNDGSKCQILEEDVCEMLNEQQELIEELQVSDEMGWKRAKYFEKELKQKKIYIKRLEYKVQKFKEENEQLREINKELGDDLHNCRLNKNIIREKLKLWQDVHKEYGIYSINDFEELMKNDK